MYMPAKHNCLRDFSKLQDLKILQAVGNQFYDKSWKYHLQRGE
jgi:hypothetical protein